MPVNEHVRQALRAKFGDSVKPGTKAIRIEAMIDRAQLPVHKKRTLYGLRIAVATGDSSDSRSD